MKTVTKILFTLFFSLLSTGIMNAQFLKRLNRRVQYSAENAAINSAERIAADAAGDAIEKGVTKGIESLFANKMEGLNSSSIKSVNSSEIPDTYDFEWMYTIQMQNNDGLFNIDYYLKSNAKYFGSKIDMKQSKSTGVMFMVTDLERKINTMFMESEGSKIAMPTSMEIDANFENEENKETTDYTLKKIGTKSILGYKCQGYRVETDIATTTIYVTNDVPISFTQLFSSNSKSVPKGFDPKLLSAMKNGLIMEMEYISKEENNSITNLKCILLSKNSFSIIKSDYQFMNIPISNN